jgi:hypothetical protein
VAQGHLGEPTPLNTIVANIVAGLGMFFSGLRMVDVNLRQAIGRQLRAMISRLTRNAWIAGVVGVACGVLVQSSSGIVFIVVSLVTNGLNDGHVGPGDDRNRARRCSRSPASSNASCGWRNGLPSWSVLRWGRRRHLPASPPNPPTRHLLTGHRHPEDVAGRPLGISTNTWREPRTPAIFAAVITRRGDHQKQNVDFG